MENLKKVSDLTDEEFMRELVYARKQKKLWYGREEELLKDLDRRTGGKE